MVSLVLKSLKTRGLGHGLTSQGTSPRYISGQYSNNISVRPKQKRFFYVVLNKIT